ncbi:hypothetical protein, partial [Vibrio anguillarum]|uniref:hypothetical protein n=1 Tax=Vibrio anguillarum TaxID=55601 RepID=UPI001F4778FE
MEFSEKFVDDACRLLEAVRMWLMFFARTFNNLLILPKPDGPGMTIQGNDFGDVSSYHFIAPPPMMYHSNRQLESAFGTLTVVALHT